MKTKKCPSCGSSDIAFILYGLPAYDEELEKKIKEQSIVLGGCCIFDDSPKYHCNSCGEEWGQKNLKKQKREF